MNRTRRLAGFVGLVASVSLVGGCSTSSDSDGTVAASTSAVATTTTATATTTSTAPTSTTTSAPTPSTTTTAASTSTTSTVPETRPSAIWPATDVVFTTPEAAATDFITNVFGAGPVLGTFAAGDQRSGEIQVFATADGVPIGEARSTLLLRQLGPSDGWFVLAAASDVETISDPESMATVLPGQVTVQGVGTGFEATIVVSAFVAGNASVELDHVVAMAGNFGEALPYSVSLDLGAASPGDVVVLLVRGGAGLETDPGDFGAVPVLIGQPPTS